MEYTHLQLADIFVRHGLYVIDIPRASGNQHSARWKSIMAQTTRRRPCWRAARRAKSAYNERC